MFYHWGEGLVGSDSKSSFLPIPQRQSTPTQMWPFLVWLGTFYAIWLAVVVVGNHWSEIGRHWGIALAMAAGSYCAGSTPMGGGTVGFPILCLLFDEPASLGRNFSLAIQSIGMVSASIFIFCQRTQLDWRMLAWTCAGALIAAPLGAVFVAPIAPDLFVKFLFAVIWASFGLMTLFKIREIAKVHGITPTSALLDKEVGLVIGAIGGLMASITGVGIDMVLYAVLVLLTRADLKIAVPTSVVAMASTSVVACFANLALGTMTEAVYGNWLAAAPIVAIGAPFGAFVVSKISRVPTLVIVSILCVGQFVWTCIHEAVGWGTLALALGGVMAFNAIFHFMYAWGGRLAIKAHRMDALTEVETVESSSGRSNQKLLSLSSD